MNDRRMPARKGNIMQGDIKEVKMRNGEIMK
jgi:hypothetical protein